MNKVNKVNTGCTPTSSNCVLWQGPCIDCINVNTGDTISDVIAEMATMLCQLSGQLVLTDVELDCLVTGVEPEKTVENILNLIIERLCSIDPDPEPTPTPEEVVVTIAPCFQYTNDDGDLITTMKVSDYAKAIGIKVCAIQSTVAQHTSTLANHETRITALEAAIDPDIVLPQITPVCVLPSVPTDIDTVLEAVESQFCTLRSVTGTSTALSQGIALQCAGLNSAAALSQPGIMSGISGWKSTVSTVADSLSNLWLTICDMRAAVAAVQNCCAPTCSDIIVDFMVSIVNNGSTANLYFSGYTFIPSGFADCNPSGSVLTVTDGVGGTYNTNINLVTASSTSSPIVIDFTTTTLAVGGTYSFTLNSCLTNTAITCNKTVIKSASGSASVCSIPSDVTASIS